jgi:hypothetical protein
LGTGRPAEFSSDTVRDFEEQQKNRIMARKEALRKDRKSGTPRLKPDMEVLEKIRENKRKAGLPIRNREPRVIRTYRVALDSHVFKDW